MKRHITKLGFLIVILLILGACDSEEEKLKKEIKQKAEAVEVEDIRFEKDQDIFIQTTEETIVARKIRTTFVQTSDPKTTVYTRWVKGKSILYATVYLADSDRKKTSKMYAEVFNKTLKVIKETKNVEK